MSPLEQGWLASGYLEQVGDWGLCFLWFPLLAYEVLVGLVGWTAVVGFPWATLRQGDGLQG